MSYLDKEGTDRGKVERPWTRLAQLKKTFSLAAEDIAEAHMYDTANKQDRLPILISLARLMDHHNPRIEDFTRLGKKLENAKLIGEEWQAGSYASAKKTPGRNAQSSSRGHPQGTAEVRASS